MIAASGLADLAGPNAVAYGLAVADKAALFVALAALAAPVAAAPAELILSRLQERENLGSTGFGQGAAIPHARIPGLAQVVIVVARLAASVDYGALDGEAVDVVVLLLSPEGASADHLKALARISRSLRDRATLTAMRAAADRSELADATTAQRPGVDQRAA